MSLYEAMADGLCGIMRAASKRGRCLDMALKEIERDPSLKLMMGPPDPGHADDTAHFWAEKQDGTVVDNSGTASENYAYEGREVDPKEVVKELEEGGAQEPDGVVWHASPSDFDEFLFKEIGFHFAETKELAENAARLNEKDSAVARPYKLTYTNMVEITGQKNGFRGYDLIDDLLKRGHIDRAQRDAAIEALYEFEDNYEEYEDREVEKMEAGGYYGPFDAYNQAEATVLKGFFDEWGIDAMKYWNTFDAYGLASLFGDRMMQEMDAAGGVKPNWSYMVFDNRQITPL